MALAESFLIVILFIVESVSRKTSVLVPQCGRIQARHTSIVRKKSFVVGKGRGITCSTGRDWLCASGKRKFFKKQWFILGHFYTRGRSWDGSHIHLC
jgi:hypothetical protein